MRRLSVVCTGLGFLSAAMGACLPTPLHAQSSGLSGVAALSSQLDDRGLAITPATPIAQGAVTWASPAGWALGLSGSTEVRSPGRFAEVLVQGSRYWALSGNWQVQANLLYYSYSGSARSRAYDRAEAGVNWIYRDILTFGLSAARAIGAQDHRPRGAADANFHWPLAWHFSLSAGAGVAQPLIAPYGPYGPYSHNNTSLYGYGLAGLIWERSSWRVELDRVMTDEGMRRQQGDMRAQPWVATISLSF
jgi:hypothetical protein